MSSEVGAGHVAVFPVMTGFKRQVSREMAASAKSGGKTFASGFRGVGSRAGRQLGDEVKRGFGAVAIGDAGFKRLQADVAKAARELSRSRLSSADAAGRLRVAEAQLADAQAKYPAGAAQVVAAEERVAAARRRSEAAAASTAAASTKLKDAQKVLADVQARTAGSASSLSGLLAGLAGKAVAPFGRFVDGFRSAGAAASAFSGRMGSLGGVVRAGLDRVVAPLARLGTAITAPFRSLGSRIGTMLSPVTSAVGRIGSAIASGPIGSAVGGLVSRFSSGMSGMVQAAGRAAAAIPRMLSDALTGPATAVVGAAAGALTASLVGGFGRLASLDTARAKLRGLGNDAETIDSIMASAGASVKGTAYGLDEAATAAAGAIGAQIAPGEDLERQLAVIKNTAAATGRSMGDMGSIFNRVATNGKASTEDIRQIADAGLPIWQKLADAYGVTTEAAMEMATEGKISFADFQAAASAAAGTVADEMGKTVPSAWKNLQAAFKRGGANLLAGIYPQLQPLLQAAINAMGPIEEKAAQLGQVLGDKVAPIIDRIIGALDSLSSGGNPLAGLSGMTGILGPLVGMIGALGAGGLGGVLSKIPMLGGMVGPLGALAGPLGVILGLLAGLVATSPELQTSLGGLVQGLLPPLLGLVQGLLPPLMSLVTSVGAMLGPLLVQIIDALAPLITQLVEQLAPIITQLVSAIIPPLIAVFAAVLPVIGSLVEAIVPLISILLDALIPIIEALLPVVTTVFEGVAAVVESVMGIVQSVIDAVMAAISGDWDAAWTHLGEAARKIFEDLGPTILGVLEGIGGKMFDAGKAIVSRLIDGIKSLFGEVGDAASSLVGKVRDFLPWSPAKKGPFSGSGWGGWGEAIGDQLAHGLDASVTLVSRASGALAEAAVPPGSAAPGVNGRGSTSTEGTRLTQINHITAEDPRVTGRYLARELMGVLG